MLIRQLIYDITVLIEDDDFLISKKLQVEI